MFKDFSDQELMLVFNALDDRLYLNEKYRKVPEENDLIRELKTQIQTEIEAR